MDVTDRDRWLELCSVVLRVRDGALTDDAALALAEKFWPSNVRLDPRRAAESFKRHSVQQAGPAVKD